MDRIGICELQKAFPEKFSSCGQFVVVSFYVIILTCVYYRTAQQVIIFVFHALKILQTVKLLSWVFVLKFFAS